MSQVISVVVPDIGDFKDVPIIDILVAVGDNVSAEDSLITLESDKAAMDVPSPAAGTVKEIKVKTGDKVSEGSLILLLEAEGATESVSAPAGVSPAPDAVPVATGSAIVEVKVPDIGDFKDVPIIDILVAVGDTVSAEDSLVTLESDKAAMDVPSPVSGTVKEIKVNTGDKVSEGSLILLLETAAAAGVVAVPDAAAPVAPSSASPAVAEPVGAAVASVGGPIYGSPSVRKLARRLGVDLSQVTGSGRRGRILPEDVEKFSKGGAAPASAGAAPSSGVGVGLDILPWPKVDFAKFGPIDVQPLSRIKKISGANLSRNWVMIPHVTQFDEADVTDLEAFRKSLIDEYAKKGVRITILAFLVKACVAALKRFPEFNASIDGENIVVKGYYNIGFAADTPAGLVVPVIKGADKKSIAEIAEEMSQLAGLAREGKLKLDDLQGGTFTISSLGGIGGVAFTPIINAPELAILGVSRTQIKPVWDGKQFVPRSMLPLSLSYDHRVIDGASGARFMAYLVSLIADMRRALL